MNITVFGNIILILSLVILDVSLYYLIEKASRELAPDEDRCEVEHAAKKSGRRKGSCLHFVFSKQSESHKERRKVCSGKQPVAHGFVR